MGALFRLGLGWMLGLELAVCLTLGGRCAAGETTAADSLEVRGAVDAWLRSLPHRRPEDILSQGEVRPLFAQLQKQGWTGAALEAILQKVPADGDFLVRTLRTPAGKAFARKVAGQKLIYDRLDRVAREPGGQPLIRDLVKLPDGERYAAVNRPRGVPDLLDLLPKDRSGKRRTIQDYDQPTGRIYTVSELLRELERARGGGLAGEASRR